jgi:RNA polymerase sigma-70 factor (ECF subfamily)
MFFFSRVETAAPAKETVPPEVKLVERACAGDEEAFADIYRAFAPMVHGIVLARVPYDEVKDIVQDVFLTAYKSLHTLRDRAALGGWLARIARNEAVEFYRKAKPTVELTEDFRGKSNPGSEAAEILKTIRSLPESYRETLVLRLIEGMNGNEIAERTGLTPQSVRVNLHRGMEMLRQRLGITVTKK